MIVHPGPLPIANPGVIVIDKMTWGAPGGIGGAIPVATHSMLIPVPTVAGGIGAGPSVSYNNG